jgi:hypothetical protein
MEAARAAWTDSRLDDLSGQVKGMDKKMDEGFVRLDEKMDAGFARLDHKVDAGFARLDDRIDNLHHALVHGMIALISIIVVLLVAFLGVVATHL